MGNELIPQYQLVQESMTIGLNEAESMKYFGANGITMSRGTYYKFTKRIKARRTKAVFYVAKNLPEVHIAQIDSLKLLRKKLFTRFLGAQSNKELCQLAETIVMIERTVSEYNGWTQKISEDTMKRFDAAGQEEEKEPTLFTL